LRVYSSFLLFRINGLIFCVFWFEQDKKEKIIKNKSRFMFFIKNSNKKTFIRQIYENDASKINKIVILGQNNLFYIPLMSI